MSVVLETSANFSNASTNISDGMASSMGVAFPIVLILGAIGILLAAQFAAPYLAKSTLLSRIGTGFATAVGYAVKGVVTLAVITTTALPVYYLSQVESQTRGIAYEYIGLAIAAFVVLVVVGWLADRAVTKFIDAHPTYEEWNDIFADSEDESEDAVVPDGGDAR